MRQVKQILQLACPDNIGLAADRAETQPMKYMTLWAILNNQKNTEIINYQINIHSVSKKHTRQQSMFSKR